MLRDILQKELDAITKQEREGILSTYLDASGFKEKVFSLTKEQWAWLNAHQRLRLGVAPNMAPFELIDEKGEYQGISSEYVSFFKDKLKVEMPPADGLSGQEVLQYARQGRLDIATAVVRTPALEDDLLFTEPYIEFPIVIFSSKDAPLISKLADTIIGGEVNLAARLEGQADPGGVLMSSETYALVHDIVNAEERPPISVKGIRRGIRPYAVLALRDEAGSRTDLHRTIRHQEKGIDLSVDLDQLTPEKRKALSVSLSDIARQLEEE